MFDDSRQLEVFPTTVDLKRIDASLNMRRFYRMSVQPDLFGGVSLVREWAVLAAEVNCWSSSMMTRAGRSMR